MIANENLSDLGDNEQQPQSITGKENAGNTRPTESEARYERGTDIDPFAASGDKELSHAKHEGNDTANNDGSVMETLDTAFHDKPGYAEDLSMAGSNRADYCEERSYGKTDDEEELDARSNEHKE